MPSIRLTGASSGVGAAIARTLAPTHQIVGIARSATNLEHCAREIGSAFQPLPGDLADIDTLPQLAQQAVEVLEGPPDVLIHNAGIFSLGPFEEVDAQRIEQIYRVNTLAPMLLTQALLPAMKQRGSGRIIVVASVAGTHGLPGQVAYCASKHGLVGFANALSAELTGSGLVVHSICPGGIDTPLWRSGAVSYPGDLDATMRPQEIADLVAFLIAQPANTRYRRIICFPDGEWH
jgi:short-subunit dehydrogenase